VGKIWTPGGTATGQLAVNLADPQQVKRVIQGLVDANKSMNDQIGVLVHQRRNALKTIAACVIHFGQYIPADDAAEGTEGGTGQLVLPADSVSVITGDEHIQLSSHEEKGDDEQPTGRFSIEVTMRQATAAERDQAIPAAKKLIIVPGGQRPN
jgi:hypothetical protein